MSCVWDECGQHGQMGADIALSYLRDRRDRHRSKSRDGSRGDKSVTIQAPGEPLLDNESTRGDERVSRGQGVSPGSSLLWGDLGSTREVASESTWVGTQVGSPIPSPE